MLASAWSRDHAMSVGAFCLATDHRVGGLDDQLVADLVEVQPLAKYNRGIRYLLTVLDVLSKYAWVQPLKDKTGVALVHAFEKILKGDVNPIDCKRIEGKNFTTGPFNDGSTSKAFNIFPPKGMLKPVWWNDLTGP